MATDPRERAELLLQAVMLSMSFTEAGSGWTHDDWDEAMAAVNEYRAICAELREAWDEVHRLREALRHIGEFYDAETSATVPADPARAGCPGPHEWVELSRYIEGILGGGVSDGD